MYRILYYSGLFFTIYLFVNLFDLHEMVDNGVKQISFDFTRFLRGSYAQPVTAFSKN